MPDPKSRTTGLVYSTDHGRMCPDCRRPTTDCSCAKQPAVAPGTGVVRVSRETKGRKGSGVTIVTGVSLDARALAALASELKRRCGSGGTVKDGVIEIQGDHRDLLVSELIRRGWRAKRGG